ncbi:MAG: hypothetical protein ACFE9D_08515 [Promethearchaeota archaeon]
MIRDVYVLRRTGEVLVHKAFSKRGVDEAIFSGFYSALSAFAEELGHGGIETIRMGDVSFYYEHSDDMLFALATDKSHNTKDARIILTEVKRQFADKYGDRLSDYDGNPAPFQKFTNEIENIVSTKRNGDGEDTLFTLPFALDGTKLKGKQLAEADIDGECILDSRIELAAVHLLLDDIRRTNPGYKSLKEGCYEFITKLLWPMWVVKGHDKRLLLIDGLKLLQPHVERGFVPPAARYEALLNVNASPEYLAVMDKLTEEVRTAARSSPIETHALPAELARLVRALSRITNGDNGFGIQLPHRLNYNQANKEADQFFAEALDTHHEAAIQWNEFRTFFDNDVKKWTERIHTEITTLEEHYETRKTTLKQDIDKALTDLAKQEEKEMATVDKWHQAEEKKLLAPLKTRLDPISQEINSQQATITQFLTSNPNEDLHADKFITKLNETLDQFNTFANELRNQAKETRRQIEQTKRGIDSLKREAQDRKSKVRLTFEAQEKKEIKRLDELEDERQIRIQETKDRLNQLESHATEIDKLIQQHIIHSQEQLNTFEEYLQEASAPLTGELTTPIYLPVYMAGLKREDESTHLIIIPPLTIPATKENETMSIGQKTAPIGVLSPVLVQYLKEPLETALATDDKFAKQVTRISPRQNLLLDPKIESLLYSGLHALWQSKLIPEHTHTQVKLACIDIYRSTNGNT